MTVYQPPVLHSSTTTILEGGTYNFTGTSGSTGFYYTDADTADADELITLDNIHGGVVEVKNATTGAVTDYDSSVTFTGADFKAGLVSFVDNADDETHLAGFNITLQDEINTVTGTFAFKVTAVNDPPTLDLLNGGVAPEIVEGASYTFGTGDISYSDVDDGDSGITYTITNLQHGHITVNNVTKTTFTAQNIIDGKVVFVHDGTEASTAGFDISVDDGNEDHSTPVASHFTINIDPMDDPTTFSGAEEGAVRALLKTSVSGKLIASDPDSATDFVVVSGQTSNQGYGTFSVAADGTWTYNLDSSAVSNLGSKDTTQDFFSVQTAGGATEAITIDITGTTAIYGTDGDDSGDSLTGDTAGNYIFGLGGNDNAFGLAGNDTMYGGTGDDTLVGGAGTDILSGDDGNDTASYEDAKLAVTASLAKSSINLGDAHGDTYSSIENLRGSDLGDKLYGDGSVNVLSGGAGNDLLDGAAGADTLDGGDGADTASYASASAGVTSSLLKPSANTGDAEGDTYVSIENLTGSSFADKLTGDTGANTLIGGTGNDVLEGGAGADRLDGGVGLDTVSYAGSAKGVTASLLKPSDNTGDAKGDIYVAIENLTGSGKADKLTGNGLANVITGGAGIDQLWGGSGADTFVFGKGDTGSSAKTADVIEDFSHAQHDIIDLIAIDANTKTGADDHFKIVASEKQALATIGSLYIETHGKDYTIFLNNDAHKGFDMAINVEGNKPVDADFHL